MGFWSRREKQKDIQSPYAEAWERAWKQFLLEQEIPSGPPGDEDQRDIVVCGGGGQSRGESVCMRDPSDRWRSVNFFKGGHEPPQTNEEGSYQARLIALIEEEESKMVQELKRLEEEESKTGDMSDRSWTDMGSFVDSVFASNPELLDYRGHH